jgi:hypothetical protein
MNEYVRQWHAWHKKLEGGLPANARIPLYQISAAVLRTHESKRVEGGIRASFRSRTVHPIKRPDQRR